MGNNDRVRALLSVVVGSLVIGLAGQAHANLAAPTPSVPAKVSQIETSARTLHVVSEQLDLDCRAVKGRAECVFRAEYKLRNTGQRMVKAPVSFVGRRTTIKTVEVDGRIVPTRKLKPAELRSLGEALGALKGTQRPGFGGSMLRHLPRPNRHGFDVVVAAQGNATVTLVGVMRPYARHRPSYKIPALRARHMFFADRLPPKSFAFEYLISPIRTWAGKAPIVKTRVRWHGELQSRVVVSCQKLPLGPQCGGGTTSGKRWRGDLDASKVDTLMVIISEPDRRPARGGAMIGVGGKVGGDKRFRTRLGFEVAGPKWLFYQAVVDTDFHRDLTTAVTISAATDNIFFLVPSASIGIGVPVTIFPETNVGVRAQVGVQWPLLGIVGSFDIYPKAKPDHFQATILALFGF